MVARRHRSNTSTRHLGDPLSRALSSIQAPNYDPHPFNDPAPVDTRAMAHAFASALKRPIEASTLFNPNVKLDTSQVQDKRGVVDQKVLRMKKRMRILAKRGSMAGDGRIERPAPQPPREGPPMRGRAGSAPKQTIRKAKPITNQGRHDG